MVFYLILLLLFCIGLCWGSFLNVIAYRLVHEPSILYPLRSQCPSCKHTLSFIDLIPLFSWLWLKGCCRYCKGPISYLYPFIECITGLVTVLLYMYITNIPYLIFAALFCSALIVIIRSDLETMLISQWTTLFLVPIAILATLLLPLPISFFESITGACSAYAFLYVLSFGYKKYKKIDGIGEGDIEMLCMIGSFLGPVGWWLTLVIASCTGTITALCLMIFSSVNIHTIKIPFGPFLAAGAFITLFGKQWLTSLFFPLL